MADPVAMLLALALALAPVPAASPTTGPTQAPGPVMEGPKPAPPLAVPRGRCSGSLPCKRLVVLASVTGGLGLTATVVGGVLAARPQRVDPADPTRAVAYRPAGAAALAIGLGVLATSVLMTLAALRASRQAQRASTALGRRRFAG